MNGALPPHVLKLRHRDSSTLARGFGFLVTVCIIRLLGSS